jgi:quinolinate synthase
MHNVYIRFDKDNRFTKFDIQMLRQEPHLIDEEYIEKVPVIVKRPKVLEVNDGLELETTESEAQEQTPLEPIMIDVVEYVEETRTRKVQAKDENGNLLFDIIEVTPLPNNAFVVLPEQHEEYLTALNSQLKDIVLINGDIEIIDKFTDKELAEQKSEQDKQELIAQAQQLLSGNDYRQTKALLGLYTDEKKQSVLNYMESLREVIRQAREGVLIELPAQTF